MTVLHTPQDCVNIAVTPKDILKLVQEGADARFGETIEKLLLTLRYHHTHQCWRKECYCEYCRFINGEYVSQKLHLHSLKKQQNRYEQLYWTGTDSELARVEFCAHKIFNQRQLIRKLKKHKRSLQENFV